MAKRITALESQLVMAVGVIETMQQQLVQQDNRVEIAKSDALVEAESQLAQTIVNAGAVKSQLEAATAASARDDERQRADHRSRLEASERVLSDHENRIKSSVDLMGERSNAVVSKLVSMEGKQSRLAVQVEELENRTDAIGNPVTRSEVNQMVDAAVDSVFSEGVTNERIKQVVKENFIPAAPSTSIDVLNLPDPRFAVIPGKG